MPKTTVLQVCKVLLQNINTFIRAENGSTQSKHKNFKQEQSLGLYESYSAISLSSTSPLKHRWLAVHAGKVGIQSIVVCHLKWFPVAQGCFHVHEIRYPPLCLDLLNEPLLSQLPSLLLLLLLESCSNCSDLISVVVSLDFLSGTETRVISLLFDGEINYNSNLVSG